MTNRLAALCAGMLLGVIATTALSGQVFVRGDANGDGFVNIADVLDLLVYTSDAGPAPAVLPAADVNDNGVVEIADVAYLLEFIFPGGPPPPLPYPAPGVDPTPPNFPAAPSGSLEFRIGDAAAACGTSVVLPLSVTNSDSLEAVNFRVAFDPLSLDLVALSSAPAASILGVNPTFSGTTMVTGGFALGIVFSFVQPTAAGLSPGPDQHLVDITLGVGIVPSGQPIAVGFVNDPAADPPQYNMASVAGAVVLASWIGGTITPTCVPLQFRRGDANEDGAVSISDAVFLILYLFRSGPASGCEQAMDVNADGGRDIADPIYLLTALFAGGTSIPAPWPGCGSAALPSPFPCASYPAACP